MKTLKMSDLRSKKLLSDDVGNMASIIAKDIKIRKLAHSFQMKCAYSPPKKYKGSIIDGRDITYNIMPEADFKFFITASAKTRAFRRYKELKGLNKVISLNEVLKNIKKRDKSDYNRKVSPLKRTKDQCLISSENESKRSFFLKIKQIIDKKLIINGNL
jgi:cytidylate kinase